MQAGSTGVMSSKKKHSLKKWSKSISYRNTFLGGQIITSVQCVSGDSVMKFTMSTTNPSSPPQASEEDLKQQIYFSAGQVAVNPDVNQISYNY